MYSLYTHFFFERSTYLYVIFVIVYFGVVYSNINILFQLRLYIPLNDGWIRGEQLRLMGLSSSTL